MWSSTAAGVWDSASQALMGEPGEVTFILSSFRVGPLSGCVAGDTRHCSRVSLVLPRLWISWASVALHPVEPLVLLSQAEVPLLGGVPYILIIWPSKCLTACWVWACCVLLVLCSRYLLWIPCNLLLSSHPG